MSNNPVELSLLVVDDSDDTREMYAMYFESVGVRVTAAANGFSALHAVKHARPDAVVMDLAMPGLTGWDVIRSLRADPATRSIPIVVVSGQPERESALAAGAALFLLKPCLPHQLLAQIRQLLDGAEEGTGA